MALHQLQDLSVPIRCELVHALFARICSSKGAVTDISTCPVVVAPAVVCDDHLLRNPRSLRPVQEIVLQSRIFT